MSSTKAEPIKICGEIIQPGESLSLAVHLPELHSCLPAYMPVKVFHGKKAGPCVLVFAALNGDELNGIEIINRLVGFRRLRKIEGTLIAIPVVNVFGIANKSKFLPGDVLLSESFPGSERGTHAQRLAHLFITQIFDLADYAVSIETGPLNYSNLPETFVDLNSDEGKKLAQVFGAPVVSQTEAPAGTLAHYSAKNNKKFLTYTAGEAKRFDAQAIKIGLRGMINLLSHLHMIPEKEMKTSKQPPTFFFEKAQWVRSTRGGISTNKVRLGSHVKKGTILSSLSDPFGTSMPTDLKSHREGIVIGINNVPLVKEGEELFKIALFPEPEKAASELSNWRPFEQESE